MNAPERPLSGIAYAIAAVSCFVVMDTTIKVVSATASILMVVWVRYLFQAIAMAVVVLPKRKGRLPPTHHPWLHVLRGVLMLLFSAVSFVGLKYIPVAEQTAIYMITPLMVTLLSVLFMGEQVDVRRWLMVLGGFTGAMLVIRPGGTSFGWAVLLPVCGMLMYAAFQMLTSRMARTEDPMFMHMSSGWVGALLMTAGLPWIWQSISDPNAWQLILLLSTMGTTGHLLFILAYSKARPPILAPYMYVQIILAMLAGWVVFDHIPGAVELMGIALITLCGAGAAMQVASNQRRSPPDNSPLEL